MEATTLEYFNRDIMEALAALQVRVTESDARYDLLEREHKELQKSNEELQSQVEWYKQRYELLQRELFGRKSERRESQDTELPLFPSFSDDSRPAPPEEKETITYERTKPGTARVPMQRGSRFPAHLRRVSVALPATTGKCPCCGDAELHEIRVETLEKLCCSRDPFYVTEYQRPLMGCRRCEHVEPLPVVPEVFERTAVDHTAVASLITNKFRYGMPLYRQWQQWKDVGLAFSADALIDWTLKGVSLVLPVWEVLKSEIIGSRYVVADDTRLRAQLVGGGRSEYRQGALWGLYSVTLDLVAFEFTPSRNHAGCLQALSHFAGVLIVDGYDGFEHLASKKNVELAHCNGHARRGFVRAEQSDKKRSGEAIAFYRALYAVEAEARDLPPDKRRELREAKARPVWDSFLKWLEQVSVATPPKSPLGKACTYVLKRYDSLTRYLSDGVIPIDNLLVERQNRPVAVGRKNFLHASSELGAEAAAAAYSLINSAGLQGIDPFIYISDILERVGSLPKSRIRDLLPHRWKNIFLDEATSRYSAPPPPPASLCDALESEEK